MAGRANTAQALAWKQNFGRQLRILRMAHGLSQEQLAHQAEIHRTYIGSVERGEQNISLVLMHTLAETLGVSPAAFFTDQEAD